MDYIYFQELFEKDLNSAINFILNDDILFEQFLNNSDKLSIYISSLNFDLIKKIIIKVQNDNLKYNNKFIENISIDNQYKIIDDVDIKDNTLVYILPRFLNSVKSYFFQKDPRALYLYKKFNIPELSKRGIIFNKNILAKKEFFALLKDESFINFRYNINNIERYNNPIIIEERVNEYYNELIGNYSHLNDLFIAYEEVLKNPKLLNTYILNFPYLFDIEVKNKLFLYLKDNNDNLHFYGINNLIDFLKLKTKEKLNEIIIDAIFKDNIYNVCINIREMLRYNKLLSNEEKVLNNEKINFYTTILNFDKISNADKMNIFMKLKDENYNLIFYTDLRTMKDVAYDKIQQKLFNSVNYSECIDKEASEKYGIDVYDLRNKEFFMLVRTQKQYKETTHCMRWCYSLISNKNTTIFGSDMHKSFLYGYISFNNDMVIHMFEKDSYSVGLKERNIRYVNRIMIPQQLVNLSDFYNEIQLLNKSINNEKHIYSSKKPDFIVVFNIIRNEHIQESKRLGIPIVVISKQLLNKDKLINISSDNTKDTYIYSDMKQKVK